MKKSVLIAAVVVMCSIILSESTETVFSNVTGAQSKRTGSPFDNQTCSSGVGCHGGTATPLIGLITSNIPVSGYLADSTYTVTATAFSTSLVRFGFEISPQDFGGNPLGTMIVTNTINTHFCAGTTNYITHTKTGSSWPDHTATWQFDWKAPAAGTGDVTFYGAFNYANNNTFNTGDTIHTSTLTVPEGTTGISNPVVFNDVNLYPNPVMNVFQLTFYLQQPEHIQLLLLSETGSLISILSDRHQSGGKQILSASLDNSVASGIYYIKLKAGTDVVIRKVIKL